MYGGEWKCGITTRDGEEQEDAEFVDSFEGACLHKPTMLFFQVDLFHLHDPVILHWSRQHTTTWIGRCCIEF